MRVRFVTADGGAIPPPDALRKEGVKVASCYSRATDASGYGFYVTIDGLRQYVSCLMPSAEFLAKIGWPEAGKSVTQDQREEIEYEICALENDIRLTVDEMNQYEDGAELTDGYGNRWRHSHAEHCGVIGRHENVVKELREQLA